MKLKFLTIKKAHCAILLTILVTICSVAGVFYAVRGTSSPKAQYTIVIDAGHGGADGGAVGKNSKVTESELNLKYALTLKAICEELGINVVLTRSDMNGLYSPFASNKKRSDMETRRQIIEQSNADLLISVHMNSFPLSSSRGPHVFYDSKNEGSKALADKIQSSLRENIAYSKQNANNSDLYILNCTDLPGALIEFGFLSNKEEENLLLLDSYRQDICYAVVCGVLDYLSM